MHDIDKLTKKVLKFRDERNWKQFHSMKDMLISLNLEATELLELIQWKSEEEFSTFVETQKKAVADELSDIFYWVLLIANDLNIDLVSAFASKMEQNEKKYPVEQAKNSARKYSELKNSELKNSEK